MIPLGVLASGYVASSALSGASYLTYSDSSTGTTTRTFAGLSLGTAASNRSIIVVTHSRYRYPTDVTIGGVTATCHAAFQDNYAHTAVWSAAVPTGATGDVVVTYAIGSPETAAVALWAAYGTLAYDTHGTNGEGNTVTLTAPSDCLAIAAVTNLSDSDHAGAVDGSSDYEAYPWYQTNVVGLHSTPAAGSHTVTAYASTYANWAMVVVDFTLT